MTNYSARPFGVAAPAIRRKAYFSFHYADIMRVNNARMTGALRKNPAAAAMRTFYDGSLWESRKLQGHEALKQLIRDGVKRTSVVCVLIGTHTWGRRWVRYEIARAIIDKRGLLGVDLNNIKHHQVLRPTQLGPNPFDYMGVRKAVPTSIYERPTYHLYVLTTGGWFPYPDFTQHRPRGSSYSPSFVDLIRRVAAQYRPSPGQRTHH